MRYDFDVFSQTNQTTASNQRSVTEIRVTWNLSSRTDMAGEISNGTYWHTDSPGNRKMLQVILDSSNEIYGAGTHWIEEPIMAV